MRILMRLVMWVGLLVCGPVMAQTEVVPFDFKSYIPHHLKEQRRYAAPVSKVVDAVTDGTWTVENGRATWRYSVQIPGASSVAFYADQVRLPAGSLVTLHSGDLRPQVYDASFWRDGRLWSRAHTGDTISVEMVLPGNTGRFTGLHFLLASKLSQPETAAPTGC